jgi:hypothetical protein
VESPEEYAKRAFPTWCDACREKMNPPEEECEECPLNKEGAE